MKTKNSTSTYEPVNEKITFSQKTTTFDSSYAYHRHDGCEIFLFLSGNIQVFIEQSCFTPLPGSLIIINPNEMHRIQCLDSTPYNRIIINIKKHYMDQLSSNDVSLSNCFYSRPLGKNNVRQLSHDALHEFLELYGKLSASKEPHCYGKEIIQNSFASLLLLLINKQFQKKTGNYQNQMPPYIITTMKYINEHLDEPLRLSVLAEQSMVSGTYLSSQFKAYTGLTLREYLLDCKINYAKQLLREGNSVTTTCYQAGFNDYANFIRSFKKCTGISPGKFRSL